MTPLTKPVVRRTEFLVRGKQVVVTIAPGGVSMRRMHTDDIHRTDWATLWRILEQQGIPVIK